MFELKDDTSSLVIKIEGYIKEENRTEEDGWPGFYSKVTTPLFSFETRFSDIMNSEVDIIKDMLKELLDGSSNEIKYFEVLDEAFNMVIYPKGRFYGKVYDSNNQLLEVKEIELSIRIPNEDYLSSTSVKYLLNEEDIKRLYDYLNNL